MVIEILAQTGNENHFGRWRPEQDHARPATHCRGKRENSRCPSGFRCCTHAMTQDASQLGW